MAHDYPKGTGVLFINELKKRENHPDFRGNVELTKEQINELVKADKEGKEMKLQVSAWQKRAKSGIKYISMQTEAYFPDEKPQRKPGKRDDWDSDDWGGNDDEDDIPFN